MNTSIAADVLLIAAAVVWILARQVRLARVKPRLLWLAPLVLAFFGIRSLPASTWHVPADLGLLAVSAPVSIGLGVWRGQTIRVWRDADGSWWRQGSALTLVLWGALIAARGLLYGVDLAVGHREATNLGAVLVVLALSFAAQNTVTALRMNAGQPAAAGPPRPSRQRRRSPPSAGCAGVPELRRKLTGRSGHPAAVPSGGTSDAVRARRRPRPGPVRVLGRCG